ncbi:MAG: gas vesicle protein [Cellvibrionaceae bacterium]|jgi:gas vesicle protein
MKRLMGFIVGAICGAAVGAAIALIFAPANGEQLRQDIKSKWDEVLEEARRAQEETQKELEDEFGQISPKE